MAKICNQQFEVSKLTFVIRPKILNYLSFDIYIIFACFRLYKYKWDILSPESATLVLVQPSPIGEQ